MYNNVFENIVRTHHMYIVNRTILICCNRKLQKYSASSKFDGVRLSDDLVFMCVSKVFLLDGVDCEDYIDVSHLKRGRDYPFGIFKLMAIVLSVLQFKTSDFTPLGIFKLLAIVLYVLRQFKTSDYPFGIFKLLAIVLTVVQFKNSDYSFGTFKLLAIVFRGGSRISS